MRSNTSVSSGWKSYLDPVALRFVGLFVLLVVVLSWLVQLEWVDRHLIGPYTSVLASMAAGLIRVLGVEASNFGSIIQQAGFAVDIKRGCDGVVASILLISACLAYPFSWKNRLLGTLIGYGLIFTLNMIRIVGLFMIGLGGSDQLFDFFHTYVSQFVVIAVTMVFWIFWAGRQSAAVRG